MKCEPICFTSDGLRLKGFLHLPDAVHPPVVVGSHGLFGTADSAKQVALAQKCIECGIGFFRFHHRGCGESEGDFEKATSLSGRSDDLVSAIEVVRKRKDTGNRIGLFGSSFGGGVVVAAAGRMDIKAIATVAAPVKFNRAEATRAVERSGESDMRAFQNKNLEFDVSDMIPKVGNIIIFHGDADEVIPVSHARELCQKAREPKKLVIWKNGDHRITDIEHQKEFMRESVSWFGKWLLETEASV